jgi:putative tryptophan/tyrosine transport system substrate-binding protein
MRRREFMTLLGGGLVAWPLAARAQQAVLRHVGVLINGRENDPENEAWLSVLRERLKQLGWSEGQNIRLDARFAADPRQFQTRAQDLLGLQPNVIVVHTTGFLAALERENRSIPIIFTGVSDPIGSGFVASLARPGGNITGFLLYEEGIAGKWLALLKEIAPRLTQAAIIANPGNSPFEYFLRSAQAAAPGLGIQVVPHRVTNLTEAERAIETFATEPNGGLVFIPDSLSLNNRDVMIALAARHRLPAVYNQSSFVRVGGLMSYSTDLADTFRGAASYVDRILRGEKPVDLPVQAPVKYETVLNLKTARALGLRVPDLLLVRADEVIE